MQTRFYQTTIYFTLIALTALSMPSVNVAAAPFEIQVFDGDIKVPPPYTLISGKRYRLQTVSPDKKGLPAQWFIAGNLGRIAADKITILTAVFVGDESTVLRVYENRCLPAQDYHIQRDLPTQNADITATFENGLWIVTERKRNQK